VRLFPSVMVAVLWRCMSMQSFDGTRVLLMPCPSAHGAHTKRHHQANLSILLWAMEYDHPCRAQLRRMHDVLGDMGDVAQECRVKQVQDDELGPNCAPNAMLSFE
jgi:hypothetical protein